MAQLELTGIVQRYGAHTVVDGVEFRLATGTIACSLALRAAARRRCCAASPVSKKSPAAKSASTTGWSAARRRTPPEKREVGMVFQDYALFPTSRWTPTSARLRPADAERRRRVDELLATIGLAGQGGKYPMNSRRPAAASSPARPGAPAPAGAPRRTLLQPRRRSARTPLGRSPRHPQERGHDRHPGHPRPARGLRHGRRDRRHVRRPHPAVGQPYNLYHRPGNRFVADFVGQGVSFLAASRRPAGRGRTRRPPSGVPVDCSIGCAACGKGCSVDVLLRPDDVVHDDQSPQAEVLNRPSAAPTSSTPAPGQRPGRCPPLVPSHHNHALGERSASASMPTTSSPSRPRPR